MKVSFTKTLDTPTRADWLTAERARVYSRLIGIIVRIPAVTHVFASFGRRSAIGSLAQSQPTSTRSRLPRTSPRMAKRHARTPAMLNGTLANTGPS